MLQHQSSPPSQAHHPIAIAIDTPAPSFKLLQIIQYPSGPPPVWSTNYPAITSSHSISPSHQLRSKITPIFSVLPRSLNLPPRSSYPPSHSSPPVSSSVNSSSELVHPSSDTPNALHHDSFHSPSCGSSSCTEDSILPKPSSITPHIQTPPCPSIPSSTVINPSPLHPHTPTSTPASPPSSGFPPQSLEPFFDPDVIFPLPLPPVDPDHVNCQLVKQLGSEEWARSRVSTMMSKEPPPRRGPIIDVKCGLPLAIRLEAVQWLLQFDLKTKDHPALSSNTRYRAVFLYSSFWSLRGLPKGLSNEMAIHTGRISAVVSLILATKVDVDVFRPLFVISLKMWAHEVADWIKLHPADIGNFERVMLQALDYKTTASTPFDFVTELVIACPDLDVIMGGCGRDWERVEEVFGITLENAIQNHGFVQFRTSVLATAALFLALEKGPFRHPGKVRSSTSWIRHLDGSWHEMASTGRSGSVSLAFKGSGVIVDAHLRSSVCETMNLAEGEVDRCKRWCRSLDKYSPA